MDDVSELLHDWRLALLALVVFGVGPGALLRLIVIAYPSTHSRRKELLAELYAVPYLERPIFVAQQLETALFEGLVARWSRAHQANTRQPASGRRLRRIVASAGMVAGLLVAIPALVQLPEWAPVLLAGTGSVVSAVVAIDMSRRARTRSREALAAIEKLQATTTAIQVQASTAVVTGAVGGFGGLVVEIETSQHTSGLNSRQD